MTNEEAIEELYRIVENQYRSAEKDKEALSMAIEALEQQPSEDCISRAEVRRILGNEVFELMKLHTVNPEDNPKADAMSYGVNWSLNTLMELPSVYPERPKGKWIYIGNSEVTGLKICECSVCGKRTYGSLKYCPNCGAEMNGGGEDES